MSAIVPPATIGVLGGGQLGRYFVIAAHKLGFRTMVLDPDSASPAGRVADEHVVAPYEDRAALDRIAKACAAVTTEFENVSAASLSYLAERIPVRPSPACVAVAQNRIAEKTFLKMNGFPCAPFAIVDKAEDFAHVDPSLVPGILKVARFGYDGKGQARVETLADAQAAFAKFQTPCVLERLMPLEKEISVVLTRADSGEVVSFPIAENTHRNGILDVSIVPARVDEHLKSEAEATARKLAQALNYVGTFCVEFFVSGGRLLVNEIAPRPHNSGHYTLDACVTNQFEQQVRALCGLPLGGAQQHSAAVMVNLLGDIWQPSEPNWSALLAFPNLKLHLYGKHSARPGRKMGHFTVVHHDLEKALDIAHRARALLGISPS
jgi:5-(carboxyamino)imidazole ribonucleotide synthase